MRKGATGVFILIGAVEAFSGTIAFTITNIYRFSVAGLNPFQLVIVGSAMEAAVFLAEVPTGVVADLKSRRLSVIIGHYGMGLAFLVEASWATFTGVLLAQILWGVAYTFTSGATTAWVTTEMGDPDRSTLTALFLRASRFGSLAAFVAVPLSFGLGTASLRAPIVAGGVIELALATLLLRVMVETQFRRADDERSNWHQFSASIRDGAAVIRRSRTLLLLVVVIVVAGASSEAFDRLNERHLLTIVGTPRFFGHSSLWTLAVLFSFSSFLGIVIPMLVAKRDPARTPAALRGWMVALVLAQAGALVVFGLTGAFVVAALALLVVERSRSVRNSLFGAWIVPLTPKAQRATVLSAMSQFDAIGQVGIGPGFGVIGRLWSVPAAIVASGAMLSTAAPVVAMAAASADPQSPGASAGSTVDSSGGSSVDSAVGSNAGSSGSAGSGASAAGSTSG